MYRVAVSSMKVGKLPKGDRRWADFTSSFVNKELTAPELWTAVQNGQAFAPWVNGGRSIDNFICGQHIAVDMDTEDEASSIAHLMRNVFVRTYASFIYTTHSHTPEAPRARVVFLLDEPIYDYERLQTVHEFIHALIPGSDPQTRPIFGYFGSVGAEVEYHGLYNEISLAVLRVLYSSYVKKFGPLGKKAEAAPVINLEQYRQAQQRVETLPSVQRASDPAFVANTIATVVAAVMSAPEGQRNHTLNRQSFLAGKDIKKGLYTESDIIPVLVDAAIGGGLSQGEAMKTIRSGLNSGQRKGTGS